MALAAPIVYGPAGLVTSTSSTASVTVAVGDVLVLLGSTPSGGSHKIAAPTGGSLAWTLRYQQGADNGNSGTACWTATATVAETFTLSLTSSGTPWNWKLLKFSGATGIGAVATAVASTSGTISLTTTQPNSAVALVIGDWNSIDGATRTWNTSAGAVTEDQYARSAPDYAVYVAHYLNVGAAGVKTVGLSAPASQRNTTVAVEITPGGPADTTAPTVPASVVATPNSSSQITVTWNASTDAVGVASYRVRRGGVDVTGATAVTGTSAIITGLSPSTAYSFTVSAVDAAGNRSAESTAAPATTPSAADTTAPTVPTGVTATPNSPTQVTVSWTASTDAVGVASYQVKRGGVVVANAVTGTSYADPGLSPATAYSYTVNAVDAAGNRSADSTAAPATTPATAVSSIKLGTGDVTLRLGTSPLDRAYLGTTLVYGSAPSGGGGGTGVTGADGRILPTAATTGPRTATSSTNAASSVGAGTYSNVNFTAAGVTITGVATFTDCKFGGWVIVAPGATGTAMNYCEIANGLSVSSADNCTFSWCDIYGGDDILHLSADNPVGNNPTNTTFQNCYCHSPAPAAGAHSDGIQATGADTLWLDNCVIDMGPWFQIGGADVLNAAFFTQASQGTFNNLKVTGGYYNGGGITFRYEGAYTGTFIVTDVTIGPDWQYSPQYNPPSGKGPTTQSNNWLKAANGSLTAITFLST